MSGFTFGTGLPSGFGVGTQQSVKLEDFLSSESEKNGGRQGFSLNTIIPVKFRVEDHPIGKIKLVSASDFTREALAKIASEVLLGLGWTCDRDFYLADSEGLEIDSEWVRWIIWKKHPTEPTIFIRFHTSRKQ